MLPSQKCYWIVRLIWSIRSTSEKKIPNYDPDDLKYFREALLDGSLTNQFYCKMAIFRNGSAQDSRTFRSPSYFRPVSNPSKKAEDDDKYEVSNVSDQEHDNNHKGVSNGSPKPMLNGGSSDADNDRAFSESSTAITDKVRKALSYESFAPNQDSRKQSLCSSSSTTSPARSSQGVVELTAPVPNMKPTMTPRTKLQLPLNTPPTVLIIYAHDPEGGCIYTRCPIVHIADHHVIRAINRQQLRHLQLLRKQYDASWGTEHDLKHVHAHILQELQTSNLAKGLYFKRCNGQYVNAIGEIHHSQAITTSAEEELERTVTKKIKQDEYFKTKKHGCAAAMDRTGNGDETAKANRVDAYTSSTAGKASISLTSSEDPLPKAIENRHDSSIDKSRFFGTHNLNADNIAIPDDFLSDSTQQSKDEVHPPTVSVCFMNHYLASTKPCGPGEQTVCLHQHISLHHCDSDIHNPKPKLPLSTLLARESLIQTSQATEEDLILTCWAMNSQQENSLHDPSPVNP